MKILLGLSIVVVLVVAIFVLSPGGIRSLDGGFSCASNAAARASNPPRIVPSCTEP